MSKTPLPYRWLPQDHPEITDMTAEQRGCYRSLIDQCWTAGSFSKDPVRMAAICAYPEPESFGKEIWPVLKEHFSPAVDGGYLYPGFSEQIKASKKLSKRNSERAKAMWLKRKEDMLAASQTVLSGILETSVKNSYVKPEEPTACQSDTELISNHNLDALGSTELVPPAYRTKAEATPKKTPGIPAKTVSQETNVRDLCFDSLAAWEEFCASYSEQGLFNNDTTRKKFEGIVLNQFWKDRLFRALERFNEHLARQRWEPQSAFYWLDEWTVHED